MQAVTTEIGLKSPERLTSTAMRKYMANLTQALNLSPTQLDWVYRYMGHSESVHLQHYRNMSGFIERVQIGKVLLMQDLNVSSKYVGKVLQDVEFSSIVSNAEKQKIAPKAEEQNEEEKDEEEQLDEPQKKKMKKNTAGTRKKWEDDEKDELRLLFSRNFNSNITPGLKEVNAAIAKSKLDGGKIWRRSWTVIKSKVAWELKK